MPIRTYKYRDCENGFSWLRFVYVADGKAYKKIYDFFIQNIYVEIDNINGAVGGQGGGLDYLTDRDGRVLDYD